MPSLSDLETQLTALTGQLAALREAMRLARIAEQYVDAVDTGSLPPINSGDYVLMDGYPMKIDVNNDGDWSFRAGNGYGYSDVPPDPKAERLYTHAEVAAVVAAARRAGIGVSASADKVQVTETPEGDVSVEFMLPNRRICLFSFAESNADKPSAGFLIATLPPSPVDGAWRIRKADALVHLLANQLQGEDETK